jgi:hypothetical protein
MLHGYEPPYPIPVLHGYVRGYIMDTFPADGHAAWLCQRFPSAGEAAHATCHSLFLGLLLASSASSLLRFLTGLLRQGRERDLRSHRRLQENGNKVNRREKRLNENILAILHYSPLKK